jgi:hypothetical protein
LDLGKYPFNYQQKTSGRNLNYNSPMFNKRGLIPSTQHGGLGWMIVAMILVLGIMLYFSQSLVGETKTPVSISTCDNAPAITILLTATPVPASTLIPSP